MNSKIAGLAELRDVVRQSGGKPILIASALWDPERREAALEFYKFMRIIDDLVDDVKSANSNMSPREQQPILVEIDVHLTALRSGVPSRPEHSKLIEIINRYQIPLWPWEEFAASMAYDVHNTGFRTFRDFLKYSEGAAVAPAALFVHLAGAVQNSDGYNAPRFNVRKVARPSALFAYLVHIIRDFQADQNEGLDYFADSLISRYGLTRSDLRAIAAGGPVNAGFRRLMKKYRNLANGYRRQVISVLQQSKNHLQPNYQLSVELIYDLYLQVFERIDPANGTFEAEELGPSMEEIHDRAIGVFDRRVTGHL